MSGAYPSLIGYLSTLKVQNFDVVQQARGRSNLGLAAVAATGSASDLTVGTLSDARLSSNVPLKNAANTFTGANTFNGNIDLGSASFVRRPDGNILLGWDATGDYVAAGSNFGTARPLNIGGHHTDIFVRNAGTVRSKWFSNGNFQVGNLSDLGTLFQVAGTANIQGAAQFGSTLSVTGAASFSTTASINGILLKNAASALNIRNSSDTAYWQVDASGISVNTGGVQWRDVTTNAEHWRLYKNSSDPTLYLRDMVNARMLVQFGAGATPGSAFTNFLSNVNVDAALRVVSNDSYIGSSDTHNYLSNTTNFRSGGVTRAFINGATGAATFNGNLVVGTGATYGASAAGRVTASQLYINPTGVKALYSYADSVYAGWINNSTSVGEYYYFGSGGHYFGNNGANQLTLSTTAATFSGAVTAAGNITATGRVNSGNGTSFGESGVGNSIRGDRTYIFSASGAPFGDFNQSLAEFKWGFTPNHGAVSLQAIDAVNNRTGYFAWFKPNGNRQGYIGYDAGNDITLKLEQAGGQFVVDGVGARIGLSGPLLKNSGGALQVRNSADSAFAGISANFGSFNGVIYSDGGCRVSGASGLQFSSVTPTTTGDTPWWMYTGNSSTLYVRDMTNARMHVTYVQGASSVAATTTLHSRLNIDGQVRLGDTVGNYSQMYLGKSGSHSTLLSNGDVDNNFVIQMLSTSTGSLFFDVGTGGIRVRPTGTGTEIFRVSNAGLVYAGAGLSVPGSTLGIAWNGSTTDRLTLNTGPGGRFLIRLGGVDVIDIERDSQLAGSLKIVAGNSSFAGYITSAFQSLSADPSTIDISSGMSRLVKNTTSGEIRHWVNDGGTMKKSAAYT